MLRLDQAMGSAPEPITPAPPRPSTFPRGSACPTPSGSIATCAPALERLLPPLCQRLETRGIGARTLRLEAYRTDQTMQWVTREPRPPVLRSRAAEPAARDETARNRGRVRHRHDTPRRHPHRGAEQPCPYRPSGGRGRRDKAAGRMRRSTISRVASGPASGSNSITRRHPASSHLPEKSALTLAAAWSDPATSWPPPPAPRPLLIWRPEPVQATAEKPMPPGQLPLAWPRLPHPRRGRSGTHLAGMVVRGSRLAHRSARLLAHRHRSGRPALALLRARRRPVAGLVLPWQLCLNRAKGPSPGQRVTVQPAPRFARTARGPRRAAPAQPGPFGKGLICGTFGATLEA